MVALVTPPDRPQIVQRIAQRIDRQGSLFATQRIAAHFIAQKYLYVTPPLPPQIDCVLLDMRDSWRTTTTLTWLKNLRDVQRQAESLRNCTWWMRRTVLSSTRGTGNPSMPRRLVERDALPPEAVHQSAESGKG